MRSAKEKKTLYGLLGSLGVYGLSLLLALLVISALVAVLGYNVPQALWTLLATSFRSAFGFAETVKKTIPLLFCTYAFSIPFMIKFFNIGGWGQMLCGGTSAAVLGLALAPLGLPGVIMVPLLLMVGMLAGGLFALVAGWLKARYDINPIISTIMLNYVALQLVNFIATSAFFKDPLEGHPITRPLPASSTLGFFGDVPHSLLLAALAVVFVYILLKHTRLGYEITAVGYNLRAAETFGIDSGRTLMLAFFIAGGLAGLGGCLEVINIHGKLIDGFARTSGAQYGIFGILTSLVVAGNPAAVPAAAFLMSVLLVGADALQRTMQIPVELVFLSQALIVLFIVIVRQKLRRGGK